MKVGIVICDRYNDCAGGKCLRSARNREGGFSCYSAEEGVEVVGFVSCGGCPGGNIEYAPEEMIKNGAEALHLATGMVVGYPPCPYVDYFVEFVESRYGIPVVVGTHPIPQNYLDHHECLTSKETLLAQPALMADEPMRRAYD